MKNDFWIQAFASLVGALSAFILSLILFYITQGARSKEKEKQLCLNTITEIETDINMLGEIISQIDDLCAEIEIEADKTKLYVPMNYKDILNAFIAQTYQEGLIRKILSSTEITELNRLLGRNSKQTDDLNIFLLNGYKGTDPNAPPQTKAQALRFFRGQKKQVEKDMRFLNDLRSRLEKLFQKKGENKKI